MGGAFERAIRQERFRPRQHTEKMAGVATAARGVCDTRVSLAPVSRKPSMKSIVVLTALLAAALAGCATKVQPAAKNVRVVSGDIVQSCDSLGIVQADRQIGDTQDNERSVLNEVINQVAARGGNAIFVMSTGNRGIDGSTITAQALRCPPQ
jgi:hypothetical protein